jgi:hypothetical protein
MSPRKTGKSSHVIPGPVSDSALKKTVLKQPEHEERYIREYVELEAGGEKVTHLEKLATENLFDRRLDAWDVRTNKDRYWVITNPTNLYSQKLFPSLDYTVSFHIGVTMRVMARQARKAPEHEHRLSQSVWRRWEQAAEALEEADEAEGFQAVGMMCRECLIAFVRSVSSTDMVPEGQKAPKAGDFVQWSGLIADTIARGNSAEKVRGYLKAMSKSTWQLVNWLTHSSNAVRFDGWMAVDAVQTLLSTFGIALVRHEKGTPDRCPKCSSYRVVADFRAELDTYVSLCEACGWTDHDLDSPSAATH